MTINTYLLNGIVISLVLTICPIKSESQPLTKHWFQQQRQKMVTEQLSARGIKDSLVLRAMLKVERHKFVPPDYQRLAYGDFPLPIGYEQTISQPYIVAFMTEQLRLNKHARVLEIGTGSGYQAAILAEICQAVYTIEIIPQLAIQAEKTLKTLGYQNIKVKIGDGYQGWPEYSPFDAIIVTCAPTNIPKPLQAQLAENGRMIIPVGEAYNQELVLLVKKGGKLSQKSILPVRFVPMLRQEGGLY
jgi:protein-L-isoaspartate(D-aspartate) O-methyltransferase